MARTEVYAIVLTAVHLVLATVEPQQTRVPYDGAQVWRTMLKFPHEYEVIQRLTNDTEISIWKITQTHVDYLVHSENMTSVQQMLAENKMTYIVLNEDVESIIRNTVMSTQLWVDHSPGIGHRLNWKKFPSLEVINEYIEYLKIKYASICTVRTIGYSIERRPIQLIHVTNGDPSNKPIVIIAGQHAREWIAITTCLYILDSLVTKFDKQPKYMKNKDWYIVPLVNPDGFLYTTYDRMWRKNRRVIDHKRKNCTGVDLNRNWNKRWKLDPDYCSNMYSGSKPFSEPELAGVRNLIQDLKDKNLEMAYVDIHSFGQRIGYPWGYTHTPSKKAKTLKYIAAGMSEAAFNATKLKYEYDAISNLYPVTERLYGVSVDWVHSLGVTRSFLIECRDNGTRGFVVGEDQIKVNGIEILAAVRFLAKDMGSPKS
ncbi:carboxypeptidase B-like [Hyposmocoma kahamanoa]|uniref:carboxypeptidase B-like n=1 Tax=Hyposmocoma kahamanoa TaxID=1477025 RepID=UPI000E6D5FFC|nr:carboxypeptidase B-like [Hyposmocoma kahamanoa]